MAHRITFITQEFRPKIGGAATVVSALAWAASAGIGRETRVLAPGKALPGDSLLPYVVERTGTRGKQDWMDRISLLHHLRRRGPGADERFVLAEPGAIRAALYAPFFGVSFPLRPILIFHGTEILRFTVFPHRRFLLRRLIRRSHCVHVLSQFNRELLQARLPDIQTPIIVAPGAPSWGQVGNHPPSTGTAKEQGDSIVILTVGRIHPRKGQLDTLKAFSRLPTSDQKRIRYRIVGPSVRSRYREEILRLAAQCAFPVELPGSLNGFSLEEEYRSADIFALTSRQARMSVEGFGLVYLDASAMGLPIVAARTGGVPEAVLDGKTGLLADEGSIDGISECLQRLIRDRPLRQRLGASGRDFAREHSWERTAAQILGPA